MKKVNGSVVQDNEEAFLFTYSEEERQQNIINKANSELVFTPEFIPYYIDVKQKYQLSHIETLLYGFIRFYMARGNKRFYFTNEQLGVVLDCGASTINNSMRTLKDRGVIKVGHKINTLCSTGLSVR